MAEYTNLSSLFTDIADAIRTKEGTTAAIPANTFADRVEAIQTGVDTTDATAEAHDIMQDKTAYVNEEKLIGTAPLAWNEKSVVSTMPSSANWNSVTYGNGKFVAVAINSSIAACSTDGINWTGITMPSSAFWRSVTYGNGKFVAVITGSSTAAYSTDGITWTETTMPGAVLWTSITYGNGMFVAVANDSGVAAYSTDGINWTATTMPSSAFWYSVTYGDGKFVAVCGNGIPAYSTDGITWTETTMPSSAFWHSVVYGNSKFVTVPYYNDIAAYSTNNIQTILGNDVQELETALAEANTTISELETDLAAANASWAGNLTFSGTYANSTYFTEAGCSLGVDKSLGYAYVTIQGGTSTSYENVYFTAASLPSRVSLLTYQQNFGTGGTASTHYTCVLTGITGKINVVVDFNNRNGTYDYVQAALTVTYA